MKSIKQTNF